MLKIHINIYQYQDKYQYLINKRESVGLKHFNDPKAFIQMSIQMICMMYTKILITITPVKKIRY